MRLLAALAFLAGIGCRTAPRPLARAPDAGAAAKAAPQLPPSQPGRQLALVGDTAVLALSAPQLAELTREQRLFAYWVAQAAAAGDAIEWDQEYRHGLEVVRLLRGILTHASGVPAALLPPLREYARRIYLVHGLHDDDTERKILPPFTYADLHTAALAAQAAGADLGFGGKPFEYAIRALEAPIFDPKVDAMRTSKSGSDPILSSAVNLYEGVTVKDLASFRDRYPLNSRLVKDAGRLVEQVYRAGAPGIPAGLYADRLARAAAHLEQALPYALGPAQRASLEQLIAYFRTGDPERFQRSQREWVKDAPPVDYILGFVETYADPRAVKALFEGFVGAVDQPRTETLRRLAASAQYFEEHKPWAPEWKRKDVQVPAVSALAILAATGENRPQSFSGVNLPNEQAERDRFGSKSFLLPGFDDAVAEVLSNAIAREFSPPSLAAELVRCRAQQRFALVAFHEVVGHASGAVSPALGADPAGLLGPSFNTLEEARADLVAHWHAQDPRTREIGLLPDLRCQELYPQFATTEWFTYVAHVPTGDRVEEDHLRADQLMIWWFTGKGAIAERHLGGKRYLVVTDNARWRSAAGELLSLLQHIKATGHTARLKDLVELHASRLDAQWRDEVLGRIRALGVPRRVAALAPRLEPVLADGKVVDAIAQPVDDLDAQILRDWASF
jgi:dipeptidyl-peptidase-3